MKLPLLLAMWPDYANQNLQGRSFKGQNLTGANFSGANICGVDFSKAILRGAKFININKNVDIELLQNKELINANFSGADIRSADFTNANLQNANFSDARAGLQKHRTIFLVIFAWAIAILPGFLLGIVGYLMLLGRGVFDITDFNINRLIGALTTTVIVGIFFITTIHKGIQSGLRKGAIAVTIAITIAIGIAIIPKDSLGGFRIFTGATAAVIVMTAAIIMVTTIAIVTAITSARAKVIATAIVVIVAITTSRVTAEAVALNIEQNIKHFFLGTAAASAALLRSRFAQMGFEGQEVTNLSRLMSLLADQSGEMAISIFKPDITITIVVSVATTIVIALLSIFISKRIMKKDEKYAIIRKFSLAYIALSGTNFRKANLTDANFTRATLKNTDFREAQLTRTYWRNAEKLDQARLGLTYLQDTKIRQLLVTGQGEGENFDSSNLRELNLYKANLQNASFIGTDFYESSLQKADLKDALLVRTKFESTDLRGSILTGVCIKDWVVTTTTKLSNIKCQYAFLEFNKSKLKVDDRMPVKGDFKDDDFILFIQSILNTVKLYHERDVNPKLALYVLKSLSEDYQSTLEIVKVEKRGESGAIIEVKIAGNLNQEKLKETYYEKYDQYLRFYMTDPKQELKSPTNIENITVHKGFVIGGSVSNSPINLENKGDTKMHSDQSRNITGGTFYNSGAGAFSLGDISGNVANTINQLADSSSPEQSEIKELLTQLQTAIETDTNLSEDDKKEALEQVKTLAEAGKNPQEGAMQKAGKTAIKILKGTISSLPSAATLVESCNKLLPLISNLIGLG